MSRINTETFDPDYRREPKTSRYCEQCGRDLKPETVAYRAFMVMSCLGLLHPDDDSTPDLGEVVGVLIGPECAKRIGLEWLRKEAA